MLETYFAKPETVERIRASWIGSEVEQYVDRLEVGDAELDVATKGGEVVAQLQATELVAERVGLRKAGGLKDCGPQCAVVDVPLEVLQLDIPQLFI
jgi:hypothetical protein